MNDLAEQLRMLVFGVEVSQPGGLVATWLLFLGTIAVTTPVALSLAFLSSRFRHLGAGVMSALTVVRGVPPLILLFAIDYFVPVTQFAKGILALSIYSLSHQCPVFYHYRMLYPESLSNVERVLQLGLLAKTCKLTTPWVLTKSFGAIHTHYVSLFKDTSIVIIIGLLELAALTKLLATRTYTMNDWFGIFLLCTLVYVLNIWFINRVLGTIRRRYFERC